MEMQSTDEILYLCAAAEARHFRRRVAPGRSRVLLFGGLRPLRSMRLRMRSMRWLRSMWFLRGPLRAKVVLGPNCRGGSALGTDLDHPVLTPI